MPKKTEDKDLWVRIGQLTESCDNLKNRVEKFIENDHAHLAATVEKLDDKLTKVALRIAYIVGGITAVSWLIQLAIGIWK